MNRTGETPDYVTDAELHVWRELALGKAPKEIAADSGTGYSTVCRHREHLYQILRVRWAAGLTLKAIEYGVIPTPTLRPLQTIPGPRYTRHHLPISP